MGKINVSDKKMKNEFLLIKMDKKTMKVENIYASDDIKMVMKKLR